MLKSPTTRRKSKKDPVGLNLVPMLDALVTLIAFLMASASFLAIVEIQSPVPVTSKRILENQLDKKPLQLTLTLTPERAEIWSPFDRIKRKRIDNLPDQIPDLVAIHSHLVSVKEKFPAETKIVLLPHEGMSYDSLIALMDVVRLFEKSDPPIFYKDPKTGFDQEITRLFPEVVFGNLLGT